MGKKYVVINGRVPGIYDTWAGDNGCEAQVRKFNGALYKTFGSDEEAEECWEKNHSLSFADFQMDRGKAIVFVAGTFNSENRRTAAAVTLVTETECQTKVSTIDYPIIYGKHNGEGELDAAAMALELATEKGIYDLMICHSYIGTYAWATGFWNAASGGADKYQSIMMEAMPSIHFCINGLEENPYMRTVKRLAVSEAFKK